MALEKSDRNYDIKSLNKVFAIGSIVLFITVLGMIADDYSRQWKDFQRKFNRDEYRRTEREIADAKRELNSPEGKKLRADLQKAERERDQRKSVLEGAEKRFSKIDAELYGKDLVFRFAKATFDSRKYDTEVEIDELRKAKRSEKADALRKELDEIKRKMDEAKLSLEEVAARQTAAKAEVAKLSGGVNDLEEKIKKMETAKGRLEKKLDKVDASFSNFLVNAPMLDFMAPTLTIQQAVLPKLRHDINFMEAERVDRCMTCHTVIDKKGYEKGAQPFRTHPRMELYVEQQSKHPMDAFGCTVCHGGRDRGTTFATTAHTPVEQKQKTDWQRKYGWEKTRYWEDPMRSRDHFYSGCLQCHSNQATVPQAGPVYAADAPAGKSTPIGIANLNLGVRTVEVAGCTGCHTIRGMQGLRKVGPDLTHIVSKTEPGWAFRWIKNPRSFRSFSRMPTFFGQDNQKDSAIGDRPPAGDLNDAEIDSIVTYLFDRSEPIQYDTISSGGNSSKGKDLLRSVGCLACHTDDPNEKFATRTHPRAFAPNLSGLGSKTSQTWIYNWLKNPKHYWKDTFMPSLRLTDLETMDISAYLTSTRNAEFDKIQAPTIKKETLDWLVREYLTSRISLTAAEAKIRTMTERDKKLYLGDKMINKYGCFACHTIKGFESAQPIGTELTEEGSKPVERLDFGLEEDQVEHTLPAWVFAKLKNPRRFDRGKIKNWDEKLKMPNFYFSDEEATALVTVIQGLAKSRMDVDMRRTLTAQETFIEQGRRVVKDHNCIGCHVIWKEGGGIRATIQDPGYYPPALDGEGEKVIPFWLFNFLQGPTTVRPWLTARMPTFGLNDHETTAITKMFAYADKAEYPFEADYYKLETPSPALTAGGAKLFTEFKCLQCHIAGNQKPLRDAADLAPNLSLAKARLRPLWIEKWLRDPQSLQAGTRMPQYFPDMKSPDKEALGGDAAEQIKALRYHVLGLAGKGPAVTTGN